MERIPDLELEAEKFMFRIDPNNWKPSEVDEKLKSVWEAKMNLGIFRYKCKIEEEKVVGELGFLLQLNPLRAEKRRKPEVIQSTRDPFDPDKFNFTKLKEEEFMFKTKNKDGSYNYIAINDSPFDQTHSLLLPDLYEKRSQVVTKSGLKFATEVILSSGVPFFRIGFNGLCAFASINHLHFHMYYLNKHMRLETVKVKHLSGNCYYQDVFPSKGYAFQIKSQNDIDPILEDVTKLTDYFTGNNVAHNLFITKGESFESQSSIYDCIRIYVWPRTPSSGWKDVKTQNPALCELFGHFLMKDKTSYEELDEASLENILKNLTDEAFESTKDSVQRLFEIKT